MNAIYLAQTYANSNLRQRGLSAQGVVTRDVQHPRPDGKGLLRLFRERSSAGWRDCAPRVPRGACGSMRRPMRIAGAGCFMPPAASVGPVAA